MLRKYRPDIDGLRALAILPVLLFHAGFTSVSGGYVGVDIFFVISGFLITSILAKDMKENTYSIADFYERRIRRIFPALFTVVLFVLLVSPFALLPDEYRFLPKEVAGVLLFVSNIVSWRKSGYFSSDAEERPLLHTWSLGVEEQFYIFAPVVLFFLLKKQKKSPEWILLVIFIVSFLISVFLTRPKPSAAFYLLPSRAWELLAGSLLAFNLVPATGKKAVNELISLTGLVSILLAIFLFNAKTHFPGYAAALPVFGSMCIIYSAEKSWVGRILSQKPVVFIGLISYSLYLWHWPLIVFFRDWNLLDNIAGRWIVIALSLVVAWLSWRFIERPFRNRTAYPVTKLYKASGWGLSMLVIITAVTFSQGGWPSRFSEQTLRLIAAHQDFSPSRAHCHFDSGLPNVSQYCHFGAGKPTVAVWADSHGVELARALGDKNVNLYEITYSGCPPNINYQPDSRPSCIKHNVRALKFLEENQEIGVVIMAARYEVYPDTIYQNINKAAIRLIAHGKKVIIIGPEPTPERDVPVSLARGSNPRFTFTSSAFGNIAKYIDAKVVRFMPTDLLCKKDQCNMLLQGKPLLFDDNHLSMSSAYYLSGFLKEKIGAPQQNPSPQGYAVNHR